MLRLISLLGIVAFLRLAWLLSNSRRLARIGPRAMIAGLLACYLFASVVGLLID